MPIKSKHELQHRVHFHDDATQIGPAVVFKTKALYPILQALKEKLEKAQTLEPVSFLTATLIREIPEALIFNAPAPGVNRFSHSWAASLGQDYWPVGGAGVFLVSVRSWTVTFTGGPGLDTALIPDEYNANAERSEVVLTREESTPDALYAKAPQSTAAEMFADEVPPPANALEALFAADLERTPEAPKAPKAPEAGERPPNPDGPVQADFSLYETKPSSPATVPDEPDDDAPSGANRLVG